MPGIILGSVSSAPSTPPVSSGELWGWGKDRVIRAGGGFGYTGILDNNSTVNQISPVQIGSLYNWKSISVTKNFAYAYSGFSPADINTGNKVAAAINTSGQLFTWGGFFEIYSVPFPPATYYYYNALNLAHGNGITARSSPIQVGTDTNWSKVSVNGLSAAAIKADGTLWTWGWNRYGQLGLGNTVNRTSPVQVGTLTNWSNVTVGKLHTIALKTDGTLWSFGGGADGQLGIKSLLDKSSPVQVGTETSWSKISASVGHNAAIKTDGTLWTWGLNSEGQLGIKDTLKRSSPVQVGNLTDWSSVSTGGNNTFAIKTNGTLWAWGTNYQGVLGINSVSNRSSPTQVGNQTNWSKVSAGSTQVLALKTDGTLWTWGKQNLYGNLGVGDYISRSSPVQIGSLNTWIYICGAYYGGFAIKS